MARIVGVLAFVMDRISQAPHAARRTSPTANGSQSGRRATRSIGRT